MDKEQSGGLRSRCLVWAVLGVLATFLWQAATVHYNYGGNWTALFCTGELQRVPPELAQGTYLFKSSHGYDGQFYRYMAHDPWMQRGLWKYFDRPAYRYGRIFVPAAAWLLAAGQQPLIDSAYVVVILLSIGLGIYWLGRFVQSHGRHPAWGLVFLLVPGTLISIDRLTVDVVLVSLCAGSLWYARRGSLVRLYVVLVLAALTRDTGLVLVAAYCAHALWNRQWRRALLLSTAALPAILWLWFADVRLAMPRQHVVPGWLFKYPVVGVFIKLFKPLTYPFARWLNLLLQVLDATALIGFVLAAVLVLRGCWRRRLDQEQWIALAFLSLTIALGGQGFWDVYAYARVYSPLFYYLGLRAAVGGSLWLLVPMVMIDLRVGMQVSAQIVTILRGLL